MTKKTDTVLTEIQTNEAARDKHEHDLNISMARDALARLEKEGLLWFLLSLKDNGIPDDLKVSVDIAERFETRLKQENTDLKLKHDKLLSFIENYEQFEKIKPTQRLLLKAQLAVMASYIKILDLRIEDLEK